MLSLSTSGGSGLNKAETDERVFGIDKPCSPLSFNSEELFMAGLRSCAGLFMLYELDDDGTFPPK